jgi:hypothetical protein
MNASCIATSARVPVRATCPPTNVSKSNLLISFYGVEPLEKCAATLADDRPNGSHGVANGAGARIENISQ